MTNRNSVVLFVSILCLLTIGSWADKVRGGQPVTSSVLVRIQSIRESDKFFRIQAEYPKFETVAPDFNQKIAHLISGKINNFKEESLDNWKARLKTLPAGESVPENPQVPFDFIASWQRAQLNHKYLSLVIKIYYFTGGAHGSEEIYAFNYDMVKKKEIKINDFLGYSEEALPTISQISAQDIISQLQSMGWKENDNLKEMVSQGTAPLPKNFRNFNFNSYSLIIYFQRYQVAPGAAGSLTVTIPKTTLQEIPVKSPYLE